MDGLTDLMSLFFIYLFMCLFIYIFFLFIYLLVPRILRQDNHTSRSILLLLL